MKKYNGKYSLTENLVNGRGMGLLKEVRQGRLDTGAIAEKLAAAVFLNQGGGGAHVPAGSPDLTVPGTFGATAGVYEVKSCKPGFKYASPITRDAPKGIAIQQIASKGGYKTAIVQSAVEQVAKQNGLTVDDIVEEHVDWYATRGGKKTGILGITNCDALLSWLSMNAKNAAAPTAQELVDGAIASGCEIALWSSATYAGGSAKTSCQSYGSTSCKIDSKPDGEVLVPVKLPGVPG